MKKTFVLLIILVVAAIAFLYTQRNRHSGPPGVFLISIDTLRADRLGCYGYERDTSPHVDAFASENILFSLAISAAPWTAPSFFSIHTSLYPSSHGRVSFPFPGRLSGRAVTLAEALQEAGYRTAAFTEGGYCQPSLGMNQGFSVFPAYQQEKFRFNRFLYAPSRLKDNFDRAIGWIQKNRKEKLFVWIQTYEPHYRYRPPEKYIQMFRPGYDESEERQRLRKAIEWWNHHQNIPEGTAPIIFNHLLHCALEEGAPVEGKEKLVEKIKEIDLPENDPGNYKKCLQFINDLYDAEIRYTDEQIGRLLQALRAEGLYENALIVFTADHGEGMGDHGVIQHGENLHLEALRVPLIVKLPSSFARFENPPAQVDDIVRTIDIMPTMLDLLSLPVPEACQGSSVVPLLAGQKEDRPAFCEALSLQGVEESQKSLIQGRWHYIYRFPDKKGTLYDLLADPDEREDVAGQYPDVVAGLHRRLFEQIKANRDMASRFKTGEGAPTPVDQEMEAQLRELGYIE